MAERLAGDTGKTYYVIKVCTRYDIMEEKRFQDAEKQSYYKAVPDNI